MSLHFTFLTSRLRSGAIFIGLLGIVAVLSGCGGAFSPGSGDNVTDSAVLSLPEIPIMVADGRRLQVLATTSIIGDVVRQVGGDAIDLTVLIQPGQDPHSYQPGAADLTAAADAGVIFVNGWDLEEGLVGALATIGGEAVVVPVSAGIVPRAVGTTGSSDGDASHHGPADPHVWQDVANVIHWVDTIRQVLSAADPARAETYAANAEAYRQELQQLDGDLRALFGGIPPERRVLVTNHDSLGYLAAAYGFKIVGTVIPSISTLAEPTAGALAELLQAMRAADICTLVVESTASEQLARTLQNELTNCADVKLITLYSDALGPVGSGADSYVGMMRANAAALVEGLSE
ncbi:MAG: zinc ABC transporter substrate-binding protein [Anaerolineae bacterium]|uniref:metal ABC transporter substrate-binding protein n=1 Tax=Promineifilum sp. TaxID=2664178 RepID=UPI002411D459|nr:metal ABC transporter substrate-binding protein [Promineifilum sp.]MCW5846360.1 zinc ABC transporter substrate-binding protein [Anaerolineae bacterium]